MQFLSHDLFFVMINYFVQSGMTMYGAESV